MNQDKIRELIRLYNADMARIYTRTGDGGTTGSLLGRMGKGDKLADALGAIDELNSWIGYCRYELLMTNEKLRKKNAGRTGEQLEKIQDNLMKIASILAGGKIMISGRETSNLEKMIDKLEEKMPKLNNFVFPYGPVQVARAVARRAERETVRLLTGGQPGISNLKKKTILAYMNRLSDALFVLARFVNIGYNFQEEIWKKRR